MLTINKQLFVYFMADLMQHNKPIIWQWEFYFYGTFYTMELQQSGERRHRTERIEPPAHVTHFLSAFDPPFSTTEVHRRALGWRHLSLISHLPAVAAYLHSHAEGYMSS